MSDDRIDRKNADPTLLRAYDEAVSERRTNHYLLPMAICGKGVFWLSFLFAMVAFDTGDTRMTFILAVSGGYLLGCFTIAVIWSPAGKRLRTFGIIVGFLILCGVVAALWTAFMNWII